MCSFESYREFFLLCAKAVTSHLSLQCQIQIWIAFTIKTKVPPAPALLFDTVPSLQICQAASPDAPLDLTRQECEDTRSTHLPSGSLSRNHTGARPGPRAVSDTLFSVVAGVQGLCSPWVHEVKNPRLWGPLCSLMR